PLGTHGVREALEVGHRHRLVVSADGPALGRVPAVVAAEDDAVDLVVDARSVLGGVDLAAPRPDRDALDVAVAVTDDVPLALVGRVDERVVGSRLPGPQVEPEHLAGETREVLRVRAVRDVAGAHDKHAVGTDRGTAARVT